MGLSSLISVKIGSIALVALIMRWEEVCADRQLQDLPFKIELNKWGQIVMSPVKIKHSFYQGRIQRLLQSLLTTGEEIGRAHV